jgi:hypothetical protein
MESLLKVVQRRFFGLVGDEFEQQQLHLVSVVSWGPFKCFKDACQTFVGRGSESLGKIVQKPVDGCNLASDRLLRRCSSV